MKKPATNFYLTAKKIWDIAVKSDSEYTAELELQLEMHKRLLNIFQVGNYYYFVFNVFQGAFDFVSEEIKNVLGYEPEEYTTEKMLDKIHPDDKIYFLNFEQGSIDFFKNLPFDKIKKYKAQYDYRIKAKNNKYVRILQQIVPIEYDETNFYHTLGIHTDISHIKQDGNPCFSLIGIDNEPSYYNIQDMVVFTKSYDLFTKREREILKYIVEGKNSKTIANDLNISLHTVNTHRKNILIKANCKSPIDLVTKVINEGLI
jgi:DNA-binding CsgD family transcriptional regulator